MLGSEVMDLLDHMCEATLTTTSVGTFTLSDTDAWATVIDACCLVCSC